MSRGPAVGLTDGAHIRYFGYVIHYNGEAADIWWRGSEYVDTAVTVEDACKLVDEWNNAK